MAPPTPTASPNSTPTATPPRVPPDERFWQHYSPHHEFPLSGVTSAALHVLVVAVLLLAAWVAFKLGWGHEKQPLPVEAVQVQGGGGGNPGGVGDAPGKGDTTAPVEDRQNQPPDTPDPQPQVKLNDLDPGKADPLAVPKVRDDHGQNDVVPSQEATKILQGIQQDALKKVFNNLAGKGEKGPGSDGGRGTGHGTATGPGVGPGTGTISERQRRALSWVVIFSTESGEDYLRQLTNIKPGNGAILAIPQADGTFRVIRDLHKHPATGAVEDISQIHRIYWVDDKRESVASLAHALGIPVPSAIVAFFPEELEQELAKMEHNYKGLNGSQIKETRFSVIANGDGTYHAAVLSQTPKR